MVQVHFTPHLSAWVPPGPHAVAAGHLAEALQAVFARYPAARSYVLDEQGRLRKHVSVFVDGQRCASLDAKLDAAAAVHVLQALSGG